MLKTTSSCVLGSSSPPRANRSLGGKKLIRSHLIEASGSSDAWYVLVGPPDPAAASRKARLGAPGLDGWE